jgi:hypothetical protein
MNDKYSQNTEQEQSHSQSLSDIDISLLSKSKTSCLDISADIKENNIEYYTQFLTSIEELLSKKNKNENPTSMKAPKESICATQYESVKLDGHTHQSNRCFQVYMSREKH